MQLRFIKTAVNSVEIVIFTEVNRRHHHVSIDVIFPEIVAFV